MPQIPYPALKSFHCHKVARPQGCPCRRVLVGELEAVCDPKERERALAGKLDATRAGEIERSKPNPSNPYARKLVARQVTQPQKTATNF